MNLLGEGRLKPPIRLHKKLYPTFINMFNNTKYDYICNEKVGIQFSISLVFQKRINISTLQNETDVTCISGKNNNSVSTG